MSSRDRARQGGVESAWIVGAGCGTCRENVIEKRRRLRVAIRDIKSRLEVRECSAGTDKLSGELLEIF
jgi:hypothetical protein